MYQVCWKYVLSAILAPIYQIDTSRFLVSQFASLWICWENVEPADENDVSVTSLWGEICKENSIYA